MNPWLIVLAIICIFIIIGVSLYLNCTLRNYDRKGLLLVEGYKKLGEKVKGKRKLCLTYKHKPKKEIMERFNDPDFETQFFDDKMCLEYLEKYFTDRVIKRYKDLKKSKYHAHAADLFRFAYLFLEGGVYLDIKTIPKAPLSDIFPSDKIVYCKGTDGITSMGPFNHIGITGGNKGSEYFINMLSFITKVPFYSFLSYLCNTYRSGRLTKYLDPKKSKRLIEKCVDSECKYQNGKKDRYGYCCGIYDESGNRLMIGRDPGYPKEY